MRLEPVHDLAEGRIAALKLDKKYSRTMCTLRFFVEFRLALQPLIEIVNGLLRQGLYVVGLCCCAAGHAQPLPVRDLNPLLSGYELPPALGPLPSGSRVSADFTIANISLDQHTAHEILQADAEVQRWQFNFTKPLNETLALRIDVPYLRLSGGVLDNFIESFHDAFGLPNGNRDLWPRDRLRIQHVRNGREDYSLNGPQHGIGDLTIRLGRRLGNHPQFDNTLWLSVKLPTGSDNKLTGSGAVDTALSFASSQQFGARFVGHQQISISKLGASKRLMTQQETWVWSGSLGLETQLTSHWHAVMQLDGHTQVFDSELRSLGKALQLSFGPRYQSNTWSSVLLISEDIAVDTAPDVQFQLHIARNF